MGLLTALLERRGLERTFVDNPAEWLLQMFGGRSNYSGVAVTPRTSMQSAAVFSCIRTSTQTMGSLPFKVYERLDGGGKREAPEHPLFPLLYLSPNPEQTAMAWRAMCQGHLMLRGNCYSQIIRDVYGRIVELWPLHPDRIRIERDQPDGPLVYYYRDPGSTLSTPGGPMRREREFRILDRDMLHIRGLEDDGIYGLSPIQHAAETIGLDLATTGYGAAFFGRGANPGGIIERPKESGGFKNPDSIARLRQQIMELYGGLDNAHRVAVLEDGMTWKQVGIPNNHAQFLETRQYQVGDIARIFGIPGVLIGHDDKTATYASAEQFFLSYEVHHIVPWATCWEQWIMLKCLAPVERARYYVKHEIDALRRGDYLGRQQGLEIQARNGAILIDEWRALEDRNPLPDGLGKRPLVTVNTVPLEIALAPPPPEPTAPAPPERTPSQRAVSESSAMLRDRAAMFAMDAARRAVRRESESVRKAAEKYAGDVAGWLQWVDGYYPRHTEFLSQSLHISRDAVRGYTNTHRAELLAEGVEVLDRWAVEAEVELYDLQAVEEVVAA